ncbi:MAG TPA: peptidyl-prolyl cis-trans isomerase [Thermodesulfobacteriota bacterium]|nr:peptidyl-prolyl cis-trans isomerase [Thermodesulfobacteriota bacterium]
MKYFFFGTPIALSILLLVGAMGFASEQNLPMAEGKRIVATVNDEPITLEEFNQELASLHAGVTEEKKVGKTKESALLRRLINMRLILQEAKRIGLDELPEVKNMVDVYSKATLRELLIERHLKDAKPDEKDVERLYKDLTKEWKIKSVIFEKEDAAKKMEEKIKAGGHFDELAKQVVADGTAKGGEEGKYVKGKDLLPQIAQTVSKMEVGSISPIIQVGTGFVILRVEDIRFPEDPEAKKLAVKQALYLQKEKLFKEYNDALMKKYVKVHKETLDGLDYESKEPGFQKLLEDQRVVAEIEGERPITVAELTEALGQQFYHGIERAIESKRLNEKKMLVLEEILYKRILRKEALRLGIDKTEAYKSKVKEYENSVIFGAFVQKAIVPDVKVTEEESKAYYNKHIGEYTFPEMMKIRSLVFVKRNAAERAIEKLRNGTELQWLMENAEGQVDKNTPDLLTFDGKSLTVRDLPEGVRKVLSGAKPGDFRLYASPEGYFYILSIEDVVPAKPQSFEEAKKAVANKVFSEKLNKAVEAWADKLRAASDVKVYMKDH